MELAKQRTAHSVCISGRMDRAFASKCLADPPDGLIFYSNCFICKVLSSAIHPNCVKMPLWVVDLRRKKRSPLAKPNPI
jgi:hypothetical protein